MLMYEIQDELAFREVVRQVVHQSDAKEASNRDDTVVSFFGQQCDADYGIDSLFNLREVILTVSFSK